MKQIFESDRIRFVEITEALIPDYLIMVNDLENVEKYLGGPHEPYTEAQEIEWVQTNLREKNPVFSMIEKKSGEFIGNIELMNVKDAVGELGIAVTAGKQNLGFGTEAITALKIYAVNRMGLNRIFLRVFPDNARAIRVYEKCGFSEYDRTESDVFMETAL